MGRWVIVGSRRVPNPIPPGRNPISWYRWKRVPVARYEYDLTEIEADETKLAADGYSKTVDDWEETLPVGRGSWAEALRRGRELRLLAERNFSLYQTPWRTTDLLEALTDPKARAKAPEVTPPVNMPYTLGPWSFAGYRCIYTMNYPGSKAIKPVYRHSNGKQETESKAEQDRAGRESSSIEPRWDWGLAAQEAITRAKHTTESGWSRFNGRRSIVDGK